MSVILLILQVVIIIGILIFFHELGHFLASRAVGVHIEEFGFGYPPRLAKIATWKGTEITLNWIPFGGFVRPKGEDDDTIEGGMAAAPAWKRLTIAAAGPLMNFLLGIIILVIIYSALGVPASDQAMITQVAPNSPAMQAGLLPGDIFISVDDVVIEHMDQLVTVINERAGSPLNVKILRDDQVETFILTPRLEPPPGEGAMGVALSNPLKPTPFFQSAGYALNSTGLIIRETLLLPVRLIRGTVDPAMVRPVGYKGIYDIYSQAVEMDQETSIATAEPVPIFTLSIIANISIALGITNLLPIPALDGGRILFTLPELILRKRIPQKWENAINTVSFLLLILLMVVITVLDFTNPIVLP
ncbi:MAG TPA: M50 family metallopeptidase [Brevefilum sp.]|nr:M50 family metallopeptidase [Brevefilum sp.]HOR19555.1 M50 family metallopeptidase [Brevefilum sp.]HPL68731.1 M50 family metallopeptidase [Brevefilum sp.]